MASAQPPPPPPSHKEYIIGGVKVLLPVKPYPSQLAMMAQIVKGLHRRQNCLLESPTGSGKSLALLCSTLAWQTAEKEKADKYNDLISQGVTDPDILARAAGLTNVPTAHGGPPSNNQRGPPPPSANFTAAATPSQDPFNVSATPQVQSTSAAAAAATGGGFIPEDEDDPDFRRENRQFRNPFGSLEAPLAVMNESLFGDDPSLLQDDVLNAQETRPRFMRVPKIYFGTRTHKQIFQIMKELRRTAYKNVKTTILSSREHTCIHPEVSKMRNKNEGCQQLNDPREGAGCRFHHGVHKIKTHDKLSQFGLQPAWDIEDLVTLGKKIGSCPYFSARSLKETADVIFCPYNYLVDPFIRDTMNIILKDQIIVLDEAHNIEDSARESTSCSLKQDDMEEGIQELKKMIKIEYCVPECEALSQMLSSLNGWIDVHKDNLTDYKEFDRSGKIFTGTEMVAHLGQLKIDLERYSELKRCLEALSADQDPEDNNPRLKTPTLMFIKGLLLMLHFLFLDDMKYRDDYRVALVKAQVRKTGRRDSSGFFSKKGVSLDWEYSLNFWCLNPGVAFLSIGSCARSVILTSGTLSPMSSFQSELAVPFQIQLEANHVIDKSQVWVGTVGSGPTNQTLQATYRNTETWEFQDELGRLVLSVCRVIPHGVLCFLPSYSMLNKLLERWQCTGIWDEISKIKVAVTEPRKSEEFEMVMSLFYDTIRDTKDVDLTSGINGAFFMAVCRGKVSEGLDFTDDNARAVITVGIPFPSIKDIQVDLKRQYNNQHYKTRGLLPGSDWYEIQAFRALNQALGRCIRHRYDWGALILVDERYQRGQLSGAAQHNKYTRGLSKWVRNKIVHHRSFPSAMANLQKFAENMVANPPKKPESLDESIVNTQVGMKQETNTTSPNKQDNSSNHINITSPNVKSQQPSESGNLSNQAESPMTSGPSQADCKVGGMDTSVIGGLNGNVEDPDFMSCDDTLVIPPSRIPITSTQIPGPNNCDFVATPSTPVKVSKVENSLPNAVSPVFKSSQIWTDHQASSSTVDEISSSGLISSYFNKPKNVMKIHTLVKTNQPSTKRKIISPVEQDIGQFNICDRKNRTSEDFSFANTDCESPLKASTVDEDKTNRKRLFNSIRSDSEQVSPKKCDSDEDLFAEYSPSKRVLKSCENKSETEKVNYQKDTPKKSHSSEELNLFLGDGATAQTSSNGLGIISPKNAVAASEKQNMKYTKKAMKSNLQSPFIVNTENKGSLEDSDMEDFCLEKSFTTPRMKKMRRLSKSKPGTDDI